MFNHELPFYAADEVGRHLRIPSWTAEGRKARDGNEAEGERGWLSRVTVRLAVDEARDGTQVERARGQGQ